MLYLLLPIELKPTLYTLDEFDESPSVHGVCALTDALFDGVNAGAGISQPIVCLNVGDEGGRGQLVVDSLAPLRQVGAAKDSSHAKAAQ